MNISEISQRYIGIYLVKGRKNMHQEMSNSTTKESFGEEIKYRASHLNSGITLTIGQNRVALCTINMLQ